MKPTTLQEIGIFLEGHGRDDFPQYNAYLERHAMKYVEDYEAYCEEENECPAFGTFLYEIVRDIPKDAGDYAELLREDEPYQQAERYRDEFGW